MNNEKMGLFISELRKTKQLTQRELAEKLNVSDKAVSKWERGLSCPDISLLLSLSDILGVTTSELLNGEQNKNNDTKAEYSVVNALEYSGEVVKNKTKSIRNIGAIAFSSVMLISIIVVSIVNLAISGTFTWSLIPISSIIFAWFIFFPSIKYERKGITRSLIALSILIFPYLLIQNNLIATTELFLSIGIRTSVISIIFLWIVFGIFKILKERKLIAAAISLLTAIPLILIINFMLSRIIAEQLFDVWDALGLSIVITVAIALFMLDFSMRKRNSG